MASVLVTELTDRGVLEVSGLDAERFLQNLVTCDVMNVAEDRGAYGALLSPQGKIVVDFLLARGSGGFLFDVRKDAVAEFAKRLSMYKLRAAVTITDLAGRMTVLSFRNTESPPILPGPVFPDPRLAALGLRAIVPQEIARGSFGLTSVVRTDEASYHKLRIELGVPEAERDFRYGEAFPHDADMDQLAGVDFKKGCYVGQEVVSRMQHRGTARRRIVKVRADGPLPAPGSALTAEARPVGTLGSTAGTIGLALVRLDRAKQAIDGGDTVRADHVAVTLTVPEWASFAWPAANAPIA